MIAAAAVAAGFTLIASGIWLSLTLRSAHDADLQGLVLIFFGLFLVAAGCVALVAA